ncbi:unknown [Ruminococcus sp. CAG:403]|nr:unknown [Ruminococcus sp. CAG:403]
MTLKKMLACLAAISMLGTVAMMTGCGSKDDSSSSSSSSESSKEASSDAADADSEEDGEDAVDEDTAAYADALAGTLWLGMDADYSCYALGFNDEEVVLEADDGSSISGYWGVTAGDPTIYIFEDAELTNQIASMPWSYDLENDLMILNDTVIMTQADSYGFEDAAAAMQQMAVAAQVQEYLQGTYWVGSDDESASAISMDSDKFEMIELSTDGELTQGSFYWSMDYDALTLYDDSYNAVLSLAWDISEDGSQLELTADDGSSVVYEQVSEEDATSVADYLYSLMGIDESAE